MTLCVYAVIRGPMRVHVGPWAVGADGRRETPGVSNVHFGSDWRGRGLWLRSERAIESSSLCDTGCKMN